MWKFVLGSQILLPVLLLFTHLLFFDSGAFGDGFGTFLVAAIVAIKVFWLSLLVNSIVSLVYLFNFFKARFVRKDVSAFQNFGSKVAFLLSILYIVILIFVVYTKGVSVTVDIYVQMFVAIFTPGFWLGPEL